MSDLASRRVSWTEATIPSADLRVALGSAGRGGRWTVISVLLGERCGGLARGLVFGLGGACGGAAAAEA
jgi:hypothetical protein